MMERLQLGLMRKIANIGYKQELKRHYSSIQVFAIAFSIMGLLPSISATLWFSVPAGPAGMVWVSCTDYPKDLSRRSLLSGMVLSKCPYFCCRSGRSEFSRCLAFGPSHELISTGRAWLLATNIRWFILVDAPFCF